MPAAAPVNGDDEQFRGQGLACGGAALRCHPPLDTSPWAGEVGLPPDGDRLQAVACGLCLATGASVRIRHQELNLACRSEDLVRTLQALRCDENFEQLIDLDVRRFRNGHMIVHHLLSLSRNLRLRVRTVVIGPVAPSAAGIYPNAGFQEALADAVMFARTTGGPRPPVRTDLKDLNR